uniref:Uncharacterized protein n=1 Tax=Arundo donax TaxID=35708 RepID=A0A0A9FEP6_ARUDO
MRRTQSAACGAAPLGTGSSALGVDLAFPRPDPAPLGRIRGLHGRGCGRHGGQGGGWTGRRTQREAGRRARRGRRGRAARPRRASRVVGHGCPVLQHVPSAARRRPVDSAAGGPQRVYGGSMVAVAARVSPCALVAGWQGGGKAATCGGLYVRVRHGVRPRCAGESCASACRAGGSQVGRTVCQRRPHERRWLRVGEQVAAKRRGSKGACAKQRRKRWPCTGT